MSCNKLLYYTIYLHLWSESLNIPCGGFIFSRVKNLYLATLLKSEPFSRCLSMIQVSVCSDISQSLIHVPSIHELWRFLSFWILPIFINGNNHQKVSYKYVGSAISLSTEQLFCSYVQVFRINSWVVHLWSRLKAYSLHLCWKLTLLPMFPWTFTCVHTFTILFLLLLLRCIHLLPIYSNDVLGLEPTITNHWKHPQKDVPEKCAFYHNLLQC